MSEDLTPLQKSVLDKYSILSEHLHNLDKTLKDINQNGQNNPEKIVTEMREIEVKISLVGTLLKGSVYSLVLQRNMKK